MTDWDNDTEDEVLIDTQTVTWSNTEVAGMWGARLVSNELIASNPQVQINFVYKDPSDYYSDFVYFIEVNGNTYSFPFDSKPDSSDYWGGAYILMNEGGNYIEITDALRDYPCDIYIEYLDSDPSLGTPQTKQVIVASDFWFNVMD